MKTLIQTLPKAELHLHIEGTLDPELMVQLAERNGVVIPYRSVEEELVAYLQKEQIPLTVCPLSNVKLRAVSDMAHHNILRLLDRGLLVTVNSDDPAYFGGYLNENFEALEAELEMNEAQLRQLVKNSFAASFLDEETKRKWHDKVDLA
jgi:adenosine deaminase